MMCAMANPKPTTYEQSIAMHLEQTPAEVRGRQYRLYDLLAAAGEELTWDETITAIYDATGLRITNPTLRSWKTRTTNHTGNRNHNDNRPSSHRQNLR